MENDAWRRLRNGDILALASLFDEYKDDLFSYGIHVFKKRELVENAIQDLFVELASKWSKLPEVNCLKAYLFRALRYKIQRQLSAFNAKNERLFTDVFDHDLTQISPEDQLVNAETKRLNDQKIRHTILQLAPREKEIIHLRFYQDLSFEKIADIMNLNYQTSRNLLARAIKKIRCKFDEHYLAQK
ncbi:MAG: sigma-70 family RNA polymerase sigma factor [Cytophagales bacterium]|nr:sigma-70 family RNA polymerase sigma factor [Cytophagales bacterium]